MNKEIEKKGINAYMIAKAYDLGDNLTQSERIKAVKCLEVFENYKEFVEKSEFVDSLDEYEKAELLDEKSLIESKSCAYLNGFFTHFKWIEWEDFNIEIKK